MLIKHTLMRLGQRQLFSTFSSKHQLPLAVHRPPLGRRNGGERHTNAHCVRGIGSRWHLSKNPKIWWQPLIISSLTLPFKSPSIHISNHVLPSTTPVEISRIMLPDDSNTSGNVHGGTILKMLEQAGHVVTSRYCNQGMDTNNLPITTVLVRLEKMDFHQPMHVGEVAQLQAAITYTSSHSLEVTVDVWAENVLRGQRRNTNTATLWYVAVTSDPKTVFQARVGGHCDQLRTLIASVPQLKGLSEAEKNAGKRRYEAQKASRMARSSESEVGTNNEVPAHIYHYPKEVGEAMVLTSQSTLANVVLPSDCTLTGHMMGGALMKMMDNAAGICACRHCHGHTVTACIDVINFHQTVTCGDIVFVTARMIFTSSKSMEIEVTTEAEGPKPMGRRITNTAHFTFVCLGKDGRAISVPPLQCRGEDEEARFEEGRQRYMARKKARMEAIKKVPKQS